MSFMKCFADDTEWFKLRATEVAWIPNSSAREVAFTKLVGDCREAARVYPSPGEVVALFVHAVAETYAAEWMAQQKRSS